MSDCEENRRGIVNKEVVSLPKYQAGLSEEWVKKQYHPERIARLASNENPLGVSPLAKNAAASVVQDLWKYSDADSRSLKEALAAYTGVAHEKIVIGNGSEDIICLICRAFLQANDRVITIHPSFLLHEIYPMEQGAEVVGVPITTDFQFDVKQLVEELKKGCKMLIFSNPSNPVGTILTHTDLLKVLDALPPETLVVIDEAYYEYVVEEKEFPDSLTLLNNIANPYAVLRTFSKAFGLAGTRVGYGLFSDSWVADQLDKVRTPFNVNLVAQSAAEASLRDKDHLEKSVRFNASEKKTNN